MSPIYLDLELKATARYFFNAAIFFIIEFDERIPSMGAHKMTDVSL